MDDVNDEKMVDQITQKVQRWTQTVRDVIAQ